MDDMQPGQLIVPHNSNEPKPAGDGSPEPERPTEQPEKTPQPAPLPEPSATATTSETIPEAAAEPATNWQFQEEADMATSTNVDTSLPAEGLNWTASEFIAHDKGASWYGLLVVGALVASTLIYIVTKDYISTVVVLFAAIVFGVFANRKPRTQQYALSVHGLQIGQKFYDFQGFKTFSVAEEGAIVSVVFTPLKRFMPPLTIYVAPDLEEQVVGFLTACLPMEQHRIDAVDNLLKRIRF